VAPRYWKVYGPDLNGRFGGLQGTGGLEAVILDADGTTTGVINDQFGNGVATVSGTGSSASVTWNTTRVGAYGPLPGIVPQTLTDVTQLAPATASRSRRIDLTGFYWLGARYYEPTSGRFLSADPMGQAASPSLYDYAGGDPVNRTDPDGRCASKLAQFMADPIGNAGLLNDIYKDVQAITDFNAQNSAPNGDLGPNSRVIIFNGNSPDAGRDNATGAQFRGTADATWALDPTHTDTIDAASFDKILGRFQGYADGSVHRLDIEGHSETSINVPAGEVQLLGPGAPFTSDEMRQLARYLASDAIIVSYGCQVATNQAYLNDMGAAAGGKPFYAPVNVYPYNRASPSGPNGALVPLDDPINNPAFSRSK
jgi:RHS repeat-associated protein